LVTTTPRGLALIRPLFALKMTFKFGSLTEGVEKRHFYGNIFAHEVFPKWSRVTIAPDDNQIRLMLEISKRWSGPYGILYVLKLPRLGHKAARYQSSAPCTWDELELFAYTFQEYFEGDGRHHLWFIDVPTNRQVIYDNHNLIYSYGDDEDVISRLRAKGFAEKEIRIPSPHMHYYNPEYDKTEDEIMNYFEWIEFPLQDEHDDP
jgi:hypothetical protein